MYYSQLCWTERGEIPGLYSTDFNTDPAITCKICNEAFVNVNAMALDVSAETVYVADATTRKIYSCQPEGNEFFDEI